MAYKIAIVGAGQLGSRYLQGLSFFEPPLEITVFDVSKQSLNVAEQRYLECNNRNHKVFYTTNIEQVPPVLDMVIVATTADVRAMTVKKINLISDVKYWILEKIVAQSTSELLEIRNSIDPTIAVWVNTPRYLMPLYSNLRKYLSSSSSINMSVTGVNGLACNSIHYIDLVSRWNNSNVMKIDTSELEKKWKPAKRNGFFEVDGKISVKFNDGSQLILSTNNENQKSVINIENDHEKWVVNESDGVAENSEGKVITGRFLLQSQITAPLLTIIFKDGKCNLPTLDESISQHVPLIESLINHWNQFMPKKVSCLPIT